MGGFEIAAIVLQSVGLATSLFLLLTCWIGRVHRHIIIITFWILTALATLNTLLPLIILKARHTDYPNIASCVARSVIAETFWTAIAGFILTFVLELARIVHLVVNAEEQASNPSETKSSWIAALLCCLPFAIAAPTAGIAGFTGPWDSTYNKGDGCSWDSSALRITQALSLTFVLLISLGVSIWIISTVWKMHRQTSSGISPDYDVGFILRVVGLGLLSATGAALAIAFKLVEAVPSIDWIFDNYVLSIPLLASCLFIGDDILQVWQRWFRCGSSNRKALMGDPPSRKLQKGEGKYAKHISMASSEFQSRMSEMPPEWVDRREAASRSNRASAAASQLFGAPKFTFNSTASASAYQIQSLKPSIKRIPLEDDEAESLQMPLSPRDETLQSPRRRHHASSSKQDSSLPIDFLSMAPRESTYTASVYSQQTVAMPSRSRATSPGQAGIGIRTVPPARKTPSPMHSPSLKSYHPEIGLARAPTGKTSKTSSTVPDIIPLRMNKNQGMSIYDLYTRDRESGHMEEKKKPKYAWI